MHEELLLENINTEVVIVFVHGFLGSPDSFRELAEAVYNEGFSAAAILLPGHGGTGRDFSRALLCNWEEKLQEEINKLGQKYKKLILMGHSMGGLLSLNAAVDNKNISAVITLSSPVYMKLFDLRNITKIFKMVFSKADDEIAKKYREACGVDKTPVWVYPLWLRQLHGLFTLIKKTKKNLEKVTAPALIIGSDNDEAVQKNSAPYIFKNIGSESKKLIILKKSWHAYFPPDEREIIKKAALKFLAKL